MSGYSLLCNTYTYDSNYIESYIKPKKFLGLITRCKDEFFIKEFVDYYLLEGVDNIYIIDDDSNDKTIYDNISDERVEIIYDKSDPFSGDSSLQMRTANELYNNIRDNFEWLIVVDVDEFITAKDNTIKYELETTFSNADCVKVPWVMMSSNGRIKNPDSVLLETTYRWNHDKKHPHEMRKFRCRYEEIEVKSIFRPSKFVSINTHVPVKYVNKNPVVVDSINNEPSILSDSYNNLRESSIKKGFLLCYHYRMISEENHINKIKNNTRYQTYTLDELKRSDHPDLIDETLKNKVLNRKV